MLRLAGERTEGTVLWMTGPETVASYVAPALTSAAQAAGRPQPRVVCILPVCVTGDPDGARARANEVFAIYAQLPSYRAMLDREGAAGPADVAIVGDEDTVSAQILGLEQAGVTDFVAGEFSGGDEAPVPARCSPRWPAELSAAPGRAAGARRQVAARMGRRGIDDTLVGSARRADDAPRSEEPMNPPQTGPATPPARPAPLARPAPAGRPAGASSAQGDARAAGPGGALSARSSSARTFRGRDPDTVAQSTICTTTPTKCQARTRLYRDGKLVSEGFPVAEISELPARRGGRGLAGST